jgi:hypothetical protein
MWLEKYDLPTLPISRDGKNTTLKEMAMEHFTQRVHDLQQRMANEGRIAEPLLSQEYLASFLQFINENGTSVMIMEMEEKVKAEQVARLTGNSKELFDLEGIQDSDRSKFVRQAVVVNHMGLRKLLDMNMKVVEKEMRGSTLTIEGLQRWRSDIEERFAKHVRNINSFRMSCQTRVDQMQQLPEVTGKAQTFLLEALRERFGGEDISTSGKISAKTRSNPKLGGLIPQMVGTLMNVMGQKTAEKAEALQQTALKEVANPLRSQTIFLHDTDMNAALTESFKDLARSVVQGACESKEFRGLVKQLDKELGTSAKVK